MHDKINKIYMVIRNLIKVFKTALFHAVLLHSTGLLCQAWALIATHKVQPPALYNIWRGNYSELDRS